MKNLIAYLLPILMLLGAPLAQAENLTWTTDFQRARYDARLNNTPLVLYYFNFEARPARDMVNDTLRNTQVMEKLRPFTRVTLNQRNWPELAREHKIIKVPTTIFFDAQGREVDRAIGYKTPEELILYLDRIAARASGSTTGFADAALDIITPAPDRRSFLVTYDNPEARTVNLIGDFNDWRGDATPMKPVGNGRWQLEVHLREGVYEYRFLVNGDQYMQDPLNVFAKPDPFGGLNSVAVAGDPVTTPLIQGESVTFLVYRPEATSIQIAGSFTKWELVTLYRKNDDPAMWGAMYNLPPGKYTYKLVVDGEWMNDPENYLLEDDGSGQRNNIFFVPRPSLSEKNTASAQNGG